MLKEVLMNTYKRGMISWMQNHPEYFEELVELALSEVPDHAWRAAWLLWSCVAQNDPRLQGKLPEFVNALNRKSGSQKREFLILISRMDIEPAWAGNLYGECIRIWTNPNYQPSLRYNAFKLLVRITREYPELKTDLLLVVQEEYLYGLSANVRKSVFSMLKALK